MSFIKFDLAKPEPYAHSLANLQLLRAVIGKLRFQFSHYIAKTMKK